MYKKGDIITIYEDPITCHKIEGKAKLMHKMPLKDDFLEMWQVRFINEPSRLFERRLIKL